MQSIKKKSEPFLEFFINHKKEVLAGGIIGMLLFSVFLYKRKGKQHLKIENPPSSKVEFVKQKSLKLDPELTKVKTKDEIVEDTLPKPPPCKNSPLLKGIQQTTLESKDSKMLEILKHSAKKLASGINLTYESGGNLSLESISDIMEKAVALGKDEFIHLIETNREERRKVFNEPGKEKYNELIIFFIEEMEKCLNQDSLIIAEVREIHRDKFEQGCMFWIEQGYVNEMFGIQANIHQKVKEIIPSKKTIDLPLLKKILRVQINFIKNKKTVFESIVEKLQESIESAQLIPQVINLYLQDETYQNFKTEEEDQINSMNKLGPIESKDLELKNLLLELQKNMNDLFQKIGLAPISITEFST